MNRRRFRSLLSSNLPAGAAWLVLLTLVVVATSCAEAPAPHGEGQEAEGSAAVEVRDSAGVSIATARLTPTTPDWRIGPEPELTLGQVDGESPYLFQRPEFAARLSSGMVVVADFGSGELRWFDMEGRFVHSVGRKGEGPWEFREFNRVVRLPGDTLVIYDRRNYRLTRLGPDGERLNELALRDLFATRLASRWYPLERAVFRMIGSGRDASLARWRHLLFAGPLPGGEHVLAFRLPPSPPPHPQVDTMRARAIVVRVNRGGEMGVVAELPGMLQVPVWVDEGPRGMLARPRSVPFATEPLVAARGGHLVISETGTYEIRIHRPDGVLHRIIRRDDVARRRVTRDLIDRFIQWKVGRPGSMVDWAERAVANTAFESAGEAYDLPTHAEIYLDPAGRIWVEDWQFPWDELEPRTFTIFQPDGRIVATATVPPELWITDIGLEHITGVVWDDLGVEYVHVYSIRR